MSEKNAGGPALGVLGGGQLGLMLAQAASDLGVRTRLLDPDPNACAAAAGELFVGDYHDPRTLARFADGLDAVTYEFENVPVESARSLESMVPVRPGPRALEVAQDRLREREMFARLGIPTPSSSAVSNEDELKSAAQDGGFPAILKTRRLGYDGKGQARVADASGLTAAWDSLGRAPAILDEMVTFERELSVIAVRTGGGETLFYPLCENTHRGGILVKTVAPAPGVDDTVRAQAHDAAGSVMESLGYVGVLAVEFFDVGGGLLANEIAPRVHNTGHWTIEGARTSQFENHARAVLGMDLGPCDAVGPSAMLNLIGEISEGLAERLPEGATLHDYGKPARPGRKVGHVTCVAEDEAGLASLIERTDTAISG